MKPRAVHSLGGCWAVALPLNWRGMNPELAPGSCQHAPSLDRRGTHAGPSRMTSSPSSQSSRASQPQSVGHLPGFGGLVQVVDSNSTRAESFVVIRLGPGAMRRADASERANHCG